MAEKLPAALERGGTTPLYLQIRNWIRERITSGAWPTGHRLDAEEKLARELGVAVGTMRQALAELAREGYVTRQHGRGTFVSGPVLEHRVLGRLLFFPEEFSEQGVQLTTRVLRQAVIPPPSFVAGALGLGPRDRVFSIRRVRAAGGVPFMLVDNYIHYDLCPGIEAFDFSEQIIGSLLEDRYGIRIDKAVRTVEPALATPEHARWLEVPAGFSLLYLHQVMSDRAGVPFEYADMWLRGDRFKFRMTLQR